MKKIIGIDVGKARLDVCVYFENENPEYVHFSNDAVGHERLIDFLSKEGPIHLVVCEPTGGYEASICEKLFKEGYLIHKVNTYSFSSFSKSVNLCKTDQKDAFKLAYYADKMSLESNYTFQKTQEDLKRYQQRREDLVIMISNEKRRLDHSMDDIDKPSIERHINFLKEEIGNLDKSLSDLIKTSADLNKKVEILTTIPGIGTCVATKLVSFLPELGDKHYTINQLAAMVGIAPYARDSGKKIGVRYIRGGRKIPRDALYIAVLSSRKWFSYLKQFYQRLIDKFKPKKVAIVACMRKLLEVAHKLVYHQRAFVSKSITT